MLGALVCLRCAADPSPGQDVQRMPAFRVKSSPLGLVGIKATLDLSDKASGSQPARLRSMTIQSIMAGSPAEHAGLRARDRVESIDGRAISEMSLADLQELIGSKKIGDSIVFVATSPRGGAQRRATMTLAPAKPAAR